MQIISKDLTEIRKILFQNNEDGRRIYYAEKANEEVPSYTPQDCIEGIVNNIYFALVSCFDLVFFHFPKEKKNQCK